jgi:hypothetical protein
MNAFVYVLINRIVYIRILKGYSVLETVLKLNKALYSLRISPLL